MGATRRTGGADGPVGASEEAAWVARARAGDRVALALLYERHERAIFGFALHMLGDPDEAAAATARAFLRAYRALDRLPAGFDAAPEVAISLHRLAARACQERLRRRRWARWLPWRRGRPAAIGDGAHRVAWRALDTLPTRDRQALILRDYTGMSYAEIAAVLGLAPDAVAGSIARAREAFRARDGTGGGE